MKILVAVKRVVTSKSASRPTVPASTWPTSMSMNPFDEIAVEEAIRLKEAGKAAEIVAVSIERAARTLAWILKAKGLFPVTIPPLPRL